MEACAIVDWLNINNDFRIRFWRFCFAFAKYAFEQAGFFIGNCFAFGWRLLNQESAAFGILTDNSQTDAVKRKGGTAPVAALIAC